MAFNLKTLIVISRKNVVDANSSTMSLFNLPMQDPDRVTLLKCPFKCLKCLKSLKCASGKRQPHGEL